MYLNNWTLVRDSNKMNFEWLLLDTIHQVLTQSKTPSVEWIKINCEKKSKIKMKSFKIWKTINNLLKISVNKNSRNIWIKSNLTLRVKFMTKWLRTHYLQFTNTMKIILKKVQPKRKRFLLKTYTNKKNRLICLKEKIKLIEIKINNFKCSWKIKLINLGCSKRTNKL